ncbi:uncharacterized protein LOC128870250 [Anastrepha ludens]|uniref:uncharacterized protein LOC128870250 n=1 Tax=Anastrepha ludens TaxID=28586 RepID=UPI0023B0D2F5|nr:uncharacterized protein LOC128870250 [Anastrepha ludens]
MRPSPPELQRHHLEALSFFNLTVTESQASDFNAHHGLWHSSLPNDRRGQQLAEQIDDSTFSTVNDEAPTRVLGICSSSADLTIASAGLINSITWRPMVSLASDHLPIIGSIERPADFVSANHRSNFNFKKANWAGFTEFTEDTFAALPIPTNVSAGERAFRKVLTATVARFIPAGSFKDIRPHFPAEAASLANERDHLRQADPGDSRIRDLNLEIRQLVDQHKRTKWVEHLKTCSLTSGVSKPWSTVRSLSNRTKHNDKVAITFNGCISSDPKRCASYFSRLFILHPPADRSKRRATRRLHKLTNEHHYCTHRLKRPNKPRVNQNRPCERTILVALDLKKAFDTVSHSTLLDDIYQSTLPPGLKRWSANYLSGRHSSVTFRDQTSKQRKIKQGVPQGGVLSPLLFNFYISKLPQPPAGVSLVSYANDCTIIASGNDIDGLCSKVNNYLTDLSRIFTARNLQLSLTNSTATLFPTWTKEIKLSLKIKVDGTPIPTVNNSKIFDVTFDSLLSFSVHTTAIATKVQNRNKVLKSLAGSTWGKDKELLLSKFKAIGRPVLNYAAPVWSPGTSDTASDMSKYCHSDSDRLPPDAPGSTPTQRGTNAPSNGA